MGDDQRRDSRTVTPWVSLASTPRRASATHTSRPVPIRGSTSTPDHSPTPRTAVSPGSARSRASRCAPSSRARAWYSPVASSAHTADPTAAASGLPPKVEPCSPGRSTPSTSRRPTTALTGTIPPPSALPRV
ncbi:hypothetical protein WY02_13255 [Pseudonocardia sp. AL041005-10]|nr:hypothetical protein WY02_13255 [Pseudonocardia sp. AL041005-10]